MSVYATAVLSDTTTAITLGDVVKDIISVLTSLFGFITSNWLLTILILAPFLIGILVALVHSLRG